MLGPVSAPTNLYQPVQESRTQAEIRTTERMPVTVAGEPYSASAAGTIAGNLNMMLLSAPERMSQNLVVLTEVLAAALKMKQEPGEPLTAFAGRLIEAIATLTPAEQQKLKTMLSDAFAGLQLRTLLQALRNPQGPEAATLAIYLELYRQKDRDPGARAVISSYRQNGGTVLAQGGRDPRISGQQSLPSTTVPARPPLTSTTSTLANAASLSLSTAAPQAAEEGAIYGAGPPTNAAEPPEANDGANLRVLRQMRERLAAADGPAQTDRLAALTQDRTDPARATMADAATQTAAALKRDQSLPVATTLPEVAAPRSAEVDRPDADAEPAAEPQPHQQKPLALPAELLDEMVETGLIRTLLALYGTDSEPDVIDLAFEALMPAEPDELEVKTQLPQASLLTENMVDDAETPALDRPLHWEEHLALATSTLVSDHRETARPAVPGDGLPLAFVNYVIDTEDDTESASSTRKESHEDEQSDDVDDEEEAPDEDATDDPAGEDTQTLTSESDAGGPGDRIDMGLATPPLDAADSLAALPSPEEDPAQALYLRLSDFA